MSWQISKDQSKQKWGISDDEYQLQAVKNIKAALAKVGKKLSTGASTLMALG